MYPNNFLKTNDKQMNYKKPIIREHKKQIHLSFTYDLADTQLTKYNTGFWFLLCVFDVFGKFAWVFHLKYKNLSQ